MQNKRILIVENDSDFQEFLVELLSNIGFNNVEIAGNYRDAINLFLKCPPNMALIDIDLRNGKSGIDVAATFNSYQKIPFAFITSNYSDEEYERAKETGPIAFLNKELAELDLRQLIELGLRQAQITKNFDIANEIREEESLILNDEIFVRIGNLLKKIPLENIDWFGIDEKYAYLKFGKKQLPLNIYLKELAAIVPRDLFIRIHQSYIINIKKIESINTINNTVTIQNKELPIGRSFKKNFFKRIRYF